MSCLPTGVSTLGNEDDVPPLPGHRKILPSCSECEGSLSPNH
jgi:hypothetical protein